MQENQKYYIENRVWYVGYTSIDLNEEKNSLFIPFIRKYFPNFTKIFLRYFKRTDITKGN